MDKVKMPHKRHIGQERVKALLSTCSGVEEQVGWCIVKKCIDRVS